MKQTNVKPADGKLGIMVVGCGAVATTFMTGVLMTRKGLAKPIGSMTQYDKIRVGKGADKKYLHVGEIVPIANLNDIEFATWDVYPQNAYQAAMYAEVLKEKDINPVRDELEKIVPMKAAFDKNYAKRLDGDNVKDCATRWEMVEALREDIRRFKAEKQLSRIVVIWAASTEIYVPVDEKVHYSLAALEQAMRDDDREHVAPSMCYAYAALSEGAPFIMGAPNTTVDIPAMWELAVFLVVQLHAGIAFGFGLAHLDDHMLAAILVVGNGAVCIQFLGNGVVFAGKTVDDGIAFHLDRLVVLPVHIQRHPTHIHAKVGAVNDKVVAFRFGIEHGQLVRGGEGDGALALNDTAGNFQCFSLGKCAFQVLCSCGNTAKKQRKRKDFLHSRS